MTLILDLPPDVEDAIRQDADRLGITPEALALSDLRRLYLQVPTGTQTGADVIAQWEAAGAFLEPQAGDLDSPERARQIREAAWQREAS